MRAYHGASLAVCASRTRTPIYCTKRLAGGKFSMAGGAAGGGAGGVTGAGGFFAARFCFSTSFAAFAKRA